MFVFLSKGFWVSISELDKNRKRKKEKKQNQVKNKTKENNKKNNILLITYSIKRSGMSKDDVNYTEISITLADRKFCLEESI